MSYILEALKKAQAERQLGHAPTLHAPTLQGSGPASATARFSKPMLLSVVAMAAVIGVLLVLVWRAPEPASAPLAATPAQPAASPLAAAAPTAAAQVSAAPATVPTPLPAPAADLPPSVAHMARAAAPAPASQPAGAAAPAPAKPSAAPEEPVVNLRDLPEPIQRSIPPVTVGGYIYSKNAADRLLLVDKILRHEGEEVAPGLLLEKLQPKEAVFNFKGYRYRVPY
ncbi:general secretion pathway protein B [Duganella sp. CF402]|uniref:general secretion pathway protein GspB n=1 Tax=unclassified Duganella TaxID=2636909 RepID=UPI0008D0FDBF|nr:MULTISPECIES: general secretion pathway protein GspB [unclassified Duganella]RZT04410.1 type II secretion system protein B [Duganella sp. BK701]SEM37439.1 general secretion pathway protein B [Duganella sp. CF402]